VIEARAATADRAAPGTIAELELMTTLAKLSALLSLLALSGCAPGSTSFGAPSAAPEESSSPGSPGSPSPMSPGSQSPMSPGSPSPMSGGSPSPGATEPLVAPAVLRDVAVIGASLSAGFGLKGASGEPLDFAEVLGAALAVEPVELTGRGALMFFLDPAARGEKAVAELAAEPPSLVVAIDFLFWFGYGERAEVDTHLARFEAGLALLDRLPCPILVGDLPDMSHAPEADAPMLMETQVPTLEALAAMNARLAEWASERPRVRVVPLASFTARMLSGERIDLRGNTWEDATDVVLQADLLHPSLEGTVGAALLVLDELERWRADVPPEMIRWDAGRLVTELAAR